MKRNDLLKILDLEEKFDDGEMGIKTAYKLGKLFSFAEKEKEEYGVFINTLMVKYGEKNDDDTLKTDEDGYVRFNQEYTAEVNQEVAEYMAEEIILKEDIKFDLEDFEKVSFGLKDIKTLTPFIKD